MWWKRLIRRVTEAEIDYVVGQSRLDVECEAFLHGRYRSYLEAEGLPVPAWAWLNILAHGNRDDVENIGQLESNSGSPDSVVTGIAAHLLQLVDEHGLTLEELQRRTLMPLEGALLNEVAVPLNSAELGKAVMTALGAGLSPLPPRRRSGGA